MENDEEKLLIKERKRTKRYKVLVILQAIATAVIVIYLVLHQISIIERENKTKKYNEELQEFYRFNAKFDSYEGVISGNSVNNLIEQVANHNTNEERKVYISYTAEDGSKIKGEITSVEKKVSPNKYYEAEISKYKVDGLVRKIVITEIGGK